VERKTLTIGDATWRTDHRDRDARPRNASSYVVGIVLHKLNIRLFGKFIASKHILSVICCCLTLPKPSFKMPSSTQHASKRLILIEREEMPSKRARLRDTETLNAKEKVRGPLVQQFRQRTTH
jgi:hypothetical protein